VKVIGFFMEDREKTYEEIAPNVGGTRLVKYGGEVPNGNAIWIKQEFDNPFGSHYDRVYLDLFRHYEKSGDIGPGDRVLETSSGAAGVSFAGIGKLLGYECFVALPGGGEKARERSIIEQLPDSEHLILTPAEKFISGFPDFLRSFLRSNKDHFYLNHSMGPMAHRTRRFSNNEITLGALAQIGDEVLEEHGEVDYFFPAVGNGSSVLGVGRPLHHMRNILMGSIGGMWEESVLCDGEFDPSGVNDAIRGVISIRSFV